MGKGGEGARGKIPFLILRKVISRENHFPLVSYNMVGLSELQFNLNW